MVVARVCGVIIAVRPGTNLFDFFTLRPTAGAMSFAAYDILTNIQCAVTLQRITLSRQLLVAPLE